MYNVNYIRVVIIYILYAYCTPIPRPIRTCTLLFHPGKSTETIFVYIHIYVPTCLRVPIYYARLTVMRITLADAPAGRLMAFYIISSYNMCGIPVAHCEQRYGLCNPWATMICRFPMEMLIFALTFVCRYATGELHLCVLLGGRTASKSELSQLD